MRCTFKLPFTLRFSDFDEKVNIFNVHQSGKTGYRRVPIFQELHYFLELLRSATDQTTDYLFPKYRTCSNIGEIIKKRMRKVGRQPWKKFFLNLRSSCITDKERLGFSKSEMNAIFGNSEAIRLGHYIQPLPDQEYGQLAFSGKKTTKTVINRSDSDSPALVPAQNPAYSSANYTKYSEDASVILWKRLSSLPRSLAEEYGDYCDFIPTLESLAGFLMRYGAIGCSNDGPAKPTNQPIVLEEDFDEKKAIDEWNSSMAFEGVNGR